VIESGFNGCGDTDDFVGSPRDLRFVLGLFGFVWVCFGFVFPVFAKCLFFIILCKYLSYVHLTFSEFGFVLHKKVIFSYVRIRTSYLVFETLLDKELWQLTILNPKIGIQYD